MGAKNRRKQFRTAADGGAKTFVGSARAIVDYDGKMPRTRAGLVILFALFCGEGVALAHIRLDEPTSRYPAPTVEDGSNLKTGPCGAAGDARTTDPSRVTTLEAGSRLTVRFHETVHHDSHYRIALDLDGQDAFVDPKSPTDIIEPPVLPVLLDGIPDKSSAADSYAVDVDLPDTTCENCTLQVIQYMYGRTEPLYYQCADIRLVRSLGNAGGAGGAANPLPPPGSGGLWDGSGGLGDGSGGSGAATSPSTNGCGVARSETTSRGPLAAMLFLGGAVFARRVRRFLRRAA